MLRVGFIKLHWYAALSLAVKVRIKNWAKNGDEEGGEGRWQGKKKKMSKQTDTPKDERYEQRFAGAKLACFSLFLSFRSLFLYPPLDVPISDLVKYRWRMLLHPSPYDDIKKYVHVNKISTRLARSKKTADLGNSCNLSQNIIKSVSSNRILVHKNFFFFCKKKKISHDRSVEIF